MTSWRRRASSLFCGALPAVFVAAALAATLAMSRWFGGFGPWIPAAILSFLVIGYFLTPPRYSIAFSSGQIPRVAAFGLAGWVVSWLGGRQKRVEVALMQACDELEERVRERTWELRIANDKLMDVETLVKALQALSSEMDLPRLIEKLVRIAMEHAGAERGLLILLRGGEPRIEAQATTGKGGVAVAVRQTVVTPSDLPQSALHYAIRTQERVLLDDASTDNVYSTDEYVRKNRSKSVLCLPIVKQAQIVGALYLENNRTPGAFTPDRVTVLQLLASQAAISLENAALYTDLQLQVGLLQHLPVSAWTLKPDGTPDFVNQVWLEFAGQTLDFVRSHPEAWMTAVHPEDREMAARIFWEGVHSGQGFAMETRSLRAQDGTYRWHLNQAVVLRDSEGKVLKFVGTTTDIDDQKRTEGALRQAQAELAHVTRVTTMGQLSASIAHEVNQPIAGVLINGNACLTWLARIKEKSVEIAEVRDTLQRIIRDGNRAGEIVARIRALFKKTESARESLDLNETIREIVTLAGSEMNKQRVTLRLELPSDLPSVLGDRVQLQQVMLNLILNAIDAMAAVEGRARDLVIQTRSREEGGVLVTVRDSGPGLDPAARDRIFTAFHTTKAGGLGMGLSISRSIVENHSGRLWATGHDGPGASFHFTLPTASKAHERRLALHELPTGRVILR